jgi:probable HAF family extracellular repeat protein
MMLTKEFKISLFATCLLFAVFASNSSAQTPSFMGIGGSVGNNQTHATKISDDGQFVAGFTTSDWTGGYYGFRWSSFLGFESVGYLPDSFFGYSRPGGISGDGSVVVGVSSGFISGASLAFYWTPENGTEVLDPSLGNSSAYGVSSDGSVVMGSGANGLFRWSAGEGSVYIGAGVASDISADGSVIVGSFGSAVAEAFRWTQGTGMVGLGDLPGGAFHSIANGVSADGSVVVGWSVVSSGNEAFLWTQDTGMMSLGTLPGSLSAEGNAVSGDGSVVVGHSYTASGTEVQAFIWDPINGMRALQDVLVDDFGLDLTGWFLRTAMDITPDGHTIVGFGYNPSGRSEGWIAVIPDLVQIIDAAIDIDPDVLNLRSNIPQITFNIWLPEGYSVNEIELNSILLNNEFIPKTVRIDTEQQVVMVKFDRSAILDILIPGNVELTITGKLIDRTVFKGMGTIIVKN